MKVTAPASGDASKQTTKGHSESVVVTLQKRRRGVAVSIFRQIFSGIEKTETSRWRASI